MPSRYDARPEREFDMAGQKIRIRLKSYDHEVIDSSARKIVDTVTRAGATVVGPVPLPTEKNVVCVIRSPHKYKDSREHFEMRTHKRLIDIVDPTPKAVDSLMRLHLPAHVNIEIKPLGQPVCYSQKREGPAGHQARHDPGLGREQSCCPGDRHRHRTKRCHTDPHDRERWLPRRPDRRRSD